MSIVHIEGISWYIKLVYPKQGKWLYGEEWN